MCSLNNYPTLFIFPYSIGTIDLISWSTISTLQTKASKVRSSLTSNRTINKPNNTQEVDKSKETIKPS